MITKDNFHLNSETTFIRVFHKPTAPPDFISMRNRIYSEFDIIYEAGDKILLEENLEVIEDNQRWTPFTATFVNRDGIKCYVCPTDEVSSQYWFTENGVFRESDHWGKCRHCMWNIDIPPEEHKLMVIGFSSWEYFRAIDPNTYDYSQNFTWAQAGKLI